MIEVAIMVEGQNGLTWARWQRIARAVEDLGFAGLYRSDHYTNANPPDKESLELWVSLTWLASHTSRIEFGPLVSPVSFRQPTMTARMASAVDDLSNGRLHLGLGAGWQEREHRNYSWDLLDMNGRFARFEEGLQIIRHLLQNEEPLDFAGDYYQLHDAVLLPRPQRPGGPPILIGGNGPRRTLPLVAEYATEWNGVYIPPQTFAERSKLLDELLVENGRTPTDVRRSLMTGLIFGKDQAELDAKMVPRTLSADELRQRGLVVGTGNQVVDQLGAFAEVGVQRIMLQWMDLDDMAGLEGLGTAVLPQLR
ncbi:MAG: TIGR03560 family F420-dependent LLM class oxidoreductase [Ardenticatenaceae bacterium]|nr:TIGR03560 family F420-dependent LLM class oxidoreductase [Anaerolineales bacterium]MCB8942006.1 TIGR03560 family F420-dependent LLM class oxidoreductase [Ardenticatenaceae bacterium]MCB8973234.1 TIGR03560 family F420-dependent LLM class oxidoreductase [Ardenticatenaceae bacterium]